MLQLLHYAFKPLRMVWSENVNFGYHPRNSSQRRGCALGEYVVLSSLYVHFQKVDVSSLFDHSVKSGRLDFVAPFHSTEPGYRSGTTVCKFHCAHRRPKRLLVELHVWERVSLDVFLQRWEVLGAGLVGNTRLAKGAAFKVNKPTCAPTSM